MTYCIEFNNLHKYNTALTALYSRQIDKRDLLEICQNSKPCYPNDIARLKTDIELLGRAIECFKNCTVK